MKKYFLLIVVFLMALTSCTNSNIIKSNEIDDIEDNELFNDFLTEEFIETMEEDLLNLHYTVYDPSKYGIEKPEASIGKVSFEDYDDIKSDLNETLDKLKAFDYNTLSSKQKYDYDSLLWYLNSSLELNNYPYFDFYFRPSSGVQNNIITNFMEFNFYDQESIDDYLELLKDIDRVFNDAIIFTKKQASNGYFMQDYTVDETVSGIDNFISEKENNQFIVSFNDKINVLDFIDDNTKQEYIKLNSEIVLNEVIPSYEMVKNELIGLKKTSAVLDAGISNYNDGKAYYEALFKYKSSSDYTVDEAFEMLNKYLINNLVNLQKVINENPDIYNEYINYSYDLNDSEAILKQLENNLSKSLPSLDKIQYVASYLDPTITDPNISAYYLSAPYDNQSLNVIRINPNNTSDTISLYITLAHEGMPGHMYQNAYYMANNPNEMMSILSFIGFSEGWAMFSEMLALDWLEYNNPLTSELLKYDIRFGYALQSIIDIGVNYYNWTTADILDYMSDFGYDDTYSALFDGIRMAVISEPGQIIPYGFGLVMMENLYNESKTIKKYSFNITEYSNAILELGNRPYSVVKNKLSAYNYSK